MERGWFKVYRGWTAHDAFEPEPFTEREAWLWLIEKAAHAPHAIALKNGKEFQIGRGEFLTSLRCLETEWGWNSVKRVRTFLRKLNQHRMLTIILAPPGTHNQTHISITNYRKFQDGGHSDGHDMGTDRAQTGHIEKNVKNGKKGKVGAARPPPAVDLPEAKAEDPDKYAWEGMIVHLSHEHYRQMFEDFCGRVQRPYRTKERFDAILADADAWFVGEEPEKRRRWFFRLRQWINREIEIKRLRPLTLNEIAG